MATPDTRTGGESASAAPRVTAVQLDRSTMEAIISGVVAQLRGKEGEASSAGGKWYMVE